MAAANGNTVRVHYTGTLEDGTVFDTSRGGEPIEFAVGMEPGDSKKLTIPATEAYGEHDPRLVQDVPRSELPQGLEPEPGMQLKASGGDGREIALVVTEVTSDVVRLDANHPLAGQDFTFEIQLVEVA